MRTFNYSEIKNQKWDSDILGLIAAIYKEAGKQEMYLKQRPEELKKLVEEKNVDCYIVNTGDFMGKKVQPKDTLGILESIVEGTAVFEKWGPFEDIEIMDWEGFEVNMDDPAYKAALKDAMQNRVDAVEGFATKKEGYDKLPDEALEAIKKVVSELE